MFKSCLKQCFNNASIVGKMQCKKLKTKWTDRINKYDAHILADSCKSNGPRKAEMEKADLGGQWSTMSVKETGKKKLYSGFEMF